MLGLIGAGSSHLQAWSLKVAGQVIPGLPATRGYMELVVVASQARAVEDSYASCTNEELRVPTPRLGLTANERAVVCCKWLARHLVKQSGEAGTFSFHKPTVFILHLAQYTPGDP